MCMYVCIYIRAFQKKINVKILKTPSPTCDIYIDKMKLKISAHLNNIWPPPTDIYVSGGFIWGFCLKL